MPVMTKLGIGCVMIPIHVLWYRFDFSRVRLGQFQKATDALSDN